MPRMITRGACYGLLLLVCTLASCARVEEQAIRHLVISELIQREHVPEGHIEINEVRFVSARQVIVEAKILPQEGRSGTKRGVHCKVEWIGQRWKITEVLGGSHA